MSGLDAAELAAVAQALDVAFRGARVRDVARLADRDDLLLFCEIDAAERPRRLALHVAPGGPRARVTRTDRRYARSEFATGPLVDGVRDALTGTTWIGATTRDGERALTLAFRSDDPDGTGGRRHLEVELFGPRGLWAVTDADGTIRHVSRLANVKGRSLRVGDIYAPPPRPAPGATPQRPPSPTPRFVDSADVLTAVDEHFTSLDRSSESATARDRVARALTRAAKRATQRRDGLVAQRAGIDGAAEVRQRADLLLAYGHGVPRGAPFVEVPDPSGADAPIRIELAPDLPVHAQAERLYKRASKLEASRDECERRLAAAESEVARLAGLTTELAAADDPGAVADLASRLVDAGILDAPDRADRDRSRISADERAKRARLAKITRGENFRRAVSSEGYLILIGRNNAQNDRLSTSVARGNDLWFHVGRGHAGSHVVVRIPKNKTASLETLLDAAHLAIHFSKARGEELCEVIYTAAKNVRKPKGLPPGAVVPSQTKGLRVRLENERLARLLASAEDA